MTLQCCRRWLFLFLLMRVGALPVPAGMQETLEAIRASQFRFVRAESEVPFLPMGWVQDRFYPNSTFQAEAGSLPGAVAAENTFGVGAVLPVHVAQRDMFLVGGDVSWDHIAVKSGPYADQSVLTLTPVAAWLHQFGTEELLGAFVAPMFSRELRNVRDWGFSGYAGVVGMHYFSDEFQLLYGGVYQHSYGVDMGYPYLGLNWLPTPRLSVAIVFPWPAISYAISDRWFVQLAMAPGGSSWVRQGGQFESTQSLSSWNASVGAGYRFYQRLWLQAGVGVAGFRSVTIEGGGNEDRLESDPGLLFSLAIQFRP